MVEVGLMSVGIVSDALLDGMTTAPRRGPSALLLRLLHDEEGE